MIILPLKYFYKAIEDEATLLLSIRMCVSLCAKMKCIVFIFIILQQRVKNIFLNYVQNSHYYLGKLDADDDLEFDCNTNTFFPFRPDELTSFLQKLLSAHRPVSIIVKYL